MDNWAMYTWANAPSMGALNCAWPVYGPNNRLSCHGTKSLLDTFWKHLLQYRWTVTSDVIGEYINVTKFIVITFIINCWFTKGTVRTMFGRYTRCLLITTCRVVCTNIWHCIYTEHTSTIRWAIVLSGVRKGCDQDEECYDEELVHVVFHGGWRDLVDESGWEEMARQNACLHGRTSAKRLWRQRAARGSLAASFSASALPPDGLLRWRPPHQCTHTLHILSACSILYHSLH